jgi:hypothetical protein
MIPLLPYRKFWQASVEKGELMRVAERMRERNIEVVIVDDSEQARKVVLERLPEGAEVCKVMNIGSFVGKILLIEREWIDGRMTVILVRQAIGI